MNKLFLSLLFLNITGSAFAQSNQTPVAAVVFKNVKTSASIAEQNKICKELHLSLGSDRGVLMDQEFQVGVDVYPTDLNKDGLEELFLMFGSTGLYGMTGSGYELYMQNKSGTFVRNAGAAGTGLPSFLSSSNLGFPDMLVGGPGFEFPVLRWNGKTYVYHKTVKDAALKGMKTTELDALRAVYVKTRK